MDATIFATPDEAEQAFYDAFQRADLAAMMSVWADRDFIECIHPMSDRVRGRTAIEASWRRIFASGLKLQIRRSGTHRTRDSLLAIHVLYEHLTVAGVDQRQSAVIATNIYQLVEGSWQMVLHHASPVSENPAGIAQGPADEPQGTRKLH